MPVVKVTEFPKEINVSNPSDYVTYTAYEPGGPKLLKKMACYAGHMASLDKMSFKLEPTEGYVAVPGETYIQFIKLAKQAGIIPEPVLEYVEDDKNHMWIPGRLYDRHTMYIIMCCYRWCISNPRMIWQFVQHMDKNPNITFWQALHFALASWCTSTGHSFSNITKSAYGNQVNLHLSQSLAIQHYCSFPIDKRPKKNGYTTDQMQQLATELDPTTTCKIKKIDDILDEKWTPLYRLEKLDKATLESAYKEIAK